MNINMLPSEAAAIVGVIDPDVTIASTVTTGWIDMADFESIMAIAQAGTLGASATLNAKLEQASDSSGTGAKDITGKAITEMTQGSPDSSDTQAIINCRAEELDLENDFTHARLSMTVAVATSDISGIVLGMNARQMPASDNDLASVAEIVA